MRRLAWPFAAIGVLATMLGVVGTIVVRIVAPAPFALVAFGFGPTVMVAFLVMGVIWATVGGFLVIRRPENVIGWIIMVVGAGYALAMLSTALAFAFVAEGTVEGLRNAELAMWATGLCTQVGALAFIIGFIFPTGRAQSPRWAWFVRIYLVDAPGLQFDRPVPARRPAPGPDVAEPVRLWAGPARGSAGIADHRVGWRHRLSRGRTFAGDPLPVGEPDRGPTTQMAHVGTGPVDHRAWGRFLCVGADEWTAGRTGLDGLRGRLAAVPVAIGIAILRYGLYDIDRIISRTIAYALISAVLVATYAAAILVLTGPLGTLFGGDTVSVALSTLVVAALFQPVRRRVQAIVDRRFDRARIDAERTTAAFSERLRDEVDIEAVTADLRETIHATVKPVRLEVWLREAGR